MLPRLAACSATLGINRAHCAKSKHADVERFKQEAARTEQLKEAVAWCKENNKKGYPASHRMDDQGNWYWPLVTEGSCNRRLAGAVDVDHPFSSHGVLTPEEDMHMVLKHALIRQLKVRYILDWDRRCDMHVGVNALYPAIRFTVWPVRA